MLDYIERQETQNESEYGENRSLKELIEQDNMPTIWKILKEKFKNDTPKDVNCCANPSMKRNGCCRNCGELIA